MGPIKRSREEAGLEDRHAKKRKGGFKVGPDNLPDGTRLRKALKIKKTLIEKAKLKKEYAKVKAQSDSAPSRALYSPSRSASPTAPAVPEPTTTPHPSRQELMDGKTPTPEPEPVLRQPRERRERRPKQAKPMPFRHEYEEAQRKKEEAEARRVAREEAAKQRQQKLEERERFRRAMAKARTGGRNGQRKLGRESGVLLEKVRRMVSEG